MRKHRVALVMSGAAVIAVASLAIIPGALAPLHTENTSWSQPVRPSSQRTMLLSNEDLAPLATFAAAYNAWLFSTYVNDELAAARAAAERETIPTAPSTVQISPSSNSAIWSCIVSHESGGDPTAENPSSGDSGLYQFNDGTWQANGGGQFGPKAMDATPAEQTEIAEATEASDGWSPWIGDGCTPLG